MSDLTSIRTADDLTYQDHGPLIRDIILETGHALPILAIVQRLAMKGVITLKTNTTVHLYPSHPFRKAVSEIVSQLYHNGELAGLEPQTKAVEAEYARIWPE